MNGFSNDIKAGRQRIVQSNTEDQRHSDVFQADEEKEKEDIVISRDQAKPLIPMLLLCKLSGYQTNYDDDDDDCWHNRQRT